MKRHYITASKLSLSVLNWKWPGWSWIATWKRWPSVSGKSLKTTYSSLSLRKFTWHLATGVTGVFCACILFVKLWQKTTKIAVTYIVVPLSDFLRQNTACCWYFLLGCTKFDSISTFWNKFPQVAQQQYVRHDLFHDILGRRFAIYAFSFSRQIAW